MHGITMKKRKNPYKGEFKLKFSRYPDTELKDYPNEIEYFREVERLARYALNNETKFNKGVVTFLSWKWDDMGKNLKNKLSFRHIA